MRRILWIVALIALAACPAMAAETTNYGLGKPARGERGWGDTINDNMDTIDAALGDISSEIADAPEVYVYTGTWNGTTGVAVSLPKAVSAVTEYGVSLGSYGDVGALYYTKSTSDVTIYNGDNDTSETYELIIYYKGDLNAYGNSQYRAWIVSAGAAITDHGDATDSGSLAWCEAQAGANNVDLRLPGNHTYAIQQNVTIDDGKRLRFDAGAVVDTDMSIRSASYQWTASGSGTSEYYLEASGGGNPSISTPVQAIEDDTRLTEGTAGSLSAGEWDWTDNDALGFSTVYVRLSDSTDPDSKSSGYVEAGYRITVPDWWAPLMQCWSGEGEIVFGDAAKDKLYAQHFASDGWDGLDAAVTALEDGTGGVVRLASEIYDGDKTVVVSSYYPISIIGQMGGKASVFGGTSYAGGYIRPLAGLSGGALIEYQAPDMSASEAHKHGGGVVRGLKFMDDSNLAVYSSDVQAARTITVEAALKLTSFDYGLVDDCNFSLLAGHAITTQCMRKAVIRDSKFEYCGDSGDPTLEFAGISGCQTQEVEVVNCSFESNFEDDYVSINANSGSNKFIGCGFETYGPDADSDQTYVDSDGEKLSIVGCKFNANDTAVDLDIAGEQSILANCQFDGDSSVTRINWSASEGTISGVNMDEATSLTGADIVTISGSINTITGLNIHRGGGLTVSGNDNLLSAVMMYDSDLAAGYLVTLSGARNVFDGFSVKSPTAAGITVTGQYNVVSDGILQDVTGHAVYVTGDYVSVSGNRMVTGTADGINLSSTSSYCTVQGNSIYFFSGDGIENAGDDNNIQGNTIRSAGEDGIEVTSDAAYTDIGGVHIDSPGDDGITIAGNPTTVSGGTIKNTTDDGVDCSVNNNVITGLRLVTLGGDGIDVSGDNNLIHGNMVTGATGSEINDTGSSNTSADNL